MNPNLHATAALIMSEEFASYCAWLTRTAEYNAKGFRNPHCVHGMPTHVDYDIPCGLCEDGQSPEDFTFEDALSYAEDRISEYNYALADYFHKIRTIIEISRNLSNPRESVRHTVENHLEKDRRRIHDLAEGIVFA